MTPGNLNHDEYIVPDDDVGEAAEAFAQGPFNDSNRRKNDDDQQDAVREKKGADVDFTGDERGVGRHNEYDDERGDEFEVGGHHRSEKNRNGDEDDAGEFDRYGLLPSLLIMFYEMLVMACY